MQNNLFTPDTGDAKMDEAYKRFLVHAEKYDDFPSFFDGFMREVKVEDETYLRRWLLKVLFTHLKHKHPFDVLREKATNKEALDKWLFGELEKLKVKN